MGNDKPSRQGILRTIAAVHHQRNQEVVTSLKRHVPRRKYVVSDVIRIKGLSVLGVRNVPNLERTPTRRQGQHGYLHYSMGRARAALQSSAHPGRRCLGRSFQATGAHSRLRAWPKRSSELRGTQVMQLTRRAPCHPLRAYEHFNRILSDAARRPEVFTGLSRS